MARSAALSNAPLGCPSTTKGLMTRPRVSMENSTTTQPSTPRFARAGGYSGGLVTRGIASPSAPFNTGVMTGSPPMPMTMGPTSVPLVNVSAVVFTRVFGCFSTGGGRLMISLISGGLSSISRTKVSIAGDGSTMRSSPSSFLMSTVIA